MILIIFAFTSCDKEKKYLRDGNKYFEEKKYSKAEDNYMKALAIDSTYKKAQYNLANSNYKKEKEDQLNKALIYYNKAVIQDSIKDTNFTANIFYNRANTNFKLALLNSVNKSEKYNEGLNKAIEDYKRTLKLNSLDTAAKYNLSLAMRLLKQSQNNNQNKQNKDKENQKQQQKQKQQQEDKNKEEDNKQEQYNKKQNQDKERMLEALKNNEKNTLERLRKEKDKNARQVRNEKDW